MNSEVLEVTTEMTNKVDAINDAARQQQAFHNQVFTKVWLGHAIDCRLCLVFLRCGKGLFRVNDGACFDLHHGHFPHVAHCFESIQKGERNFFCMDYGWGFFLCGI